VGDGGSVCQSPDAACPSPSTPAVRWECEQARDCNGNPHGAVCCGTGALAAADCSGTNFATVDVDAGFAGTYCTTNCVGPDYVVCEASGDCPSATCLLTRGLGNQFGHCAEPDGGACSACVQSAEACVAPLAIGDCMSTCTDGVLSCAPIDTVPLGANSPIGIAFDGTNMWVTDFGGTDIAKVSPTLRVSTFPLGSNLETEGIAFDRTNMWVTNQGDSSLKKISPSGAVIGTFTVGSEPNAIAFDGTNMWVTLQGGTVVEVASDGTVGTTVALQSGPSGIAFDGMNMWITAHDGTVYTLAVVYGMLGSYPAVGNNLSAIAFDGLNMWVTDQQDNKVIELAPDGAAIGAYPVGQEPFGIAFDGTNMWVTNHGDDTVTELSPWGATIGTFAVGMMPYGIAFDGLHMWVANYGNGSAGNGTLTVL
jgi:hypothetical protein